MNGRMEVSHEQLLDRLRYATTVVVIGGDPDDPAATFMDVAEVPNGRPICKVDQAKMLIDAAQHLAEHHDCT